FYFDSESGDRRYFCPSCDRTYSSRSSLKRHLNYECGKLPSFQCSQCNYATKRKTSLASHFYRKHGGEDAGNRMESDCYIVP
ncbi:hypothetical protein WDU94_006148, partial [Cyamophila willieti]